MNRIKLKKGSFNAYLNGVHHESENRALEQQILEDQKFREQHKCSFEDEGTHCPYQENYDILNRRIQKRIEELDHESVTIACCEGESEIGHYIQAELEKLLGEKK